MQLLGTAVIRYALVAAVLLSCGTAKREASSLASAVDRYRRADNRSKATEAQHVAAVVCSDAKVCDAKNSCLAAIEPTTNALAIKDEVARRLVDIEERRISADSPEAQRLPDKLHEAERLLNEGRAGMADCEKRLTELQVEFGL